MSAMQFLVETLFSLAMILVLMRFWLQLARADFYNPLSQTVVRLTNPVITPLRRVIPGFAGLDMASLVLAYLLAVLKIVVLMMMFSQFNLVAAAILGLKALASEMLSLVFWVLLLMALLSWFVQGYHPVAAVLHQLAEPIVRPIRKIIPPMGGLDLSVMIALIAIKFVQLLLFGQ